MLKFKPEGEYALHQTHRLGGHWATPSPCLLTQKHVVSPGTWLPLSDSYFFLGKLSASVTLLVSDSQLIRLNGKVSDQFGASILVLVGKWMFGREPMAWRQSWLPGKSRRDFHCHRPQGAATGRTATACAGIVTVKDQTETQPYLAAAAVGGRLGVTSTLQLWNPGRVLSSFSTGTPTR